MRLFTFATCLALLPTAAHAADPDFEGDDYLGWSFEAVERDSDFVEVRGYTHEQAWLRVPYWNRHEVERTWQTGADDTRLQRSGDVCHWEQSYYDRTYEFLASLRTRLTHKWLLDQVAQAYFQTVGAATFVGGLGSHHAYGALGNAAWEGRAALDVARNAATLIANGTEVIGTVGDCAGLVTAEAEAAALAQTSVRAVAPSAGRVAALGAGATVALTGGAIILSFGLITEIQRATGLGEYIEQSDEWVVDDVWFDQIRAPYDQWWHQTYELNGTLKSPLQWTSSGTLRSAVFGWERISADFPCDDALQAAPFEGAEVVETWFDHETKRPDDQPADPVVPRAPARAESRLSE